MTNMADEMVFNVRTTVTKTKKELESQSANIAAALEALERICHVAEAVGDKTVEGLVRSAESSFAVTKTLVDAASQECGRLQGLGSQVAEKPCHEGKSTGAEMQVTKEASAKLVQMMSEYVNRVINEDFTKRFFPLVTFLIKSLALKDSRSVMAELTKEANRGGVSVGSLDALSGTTFEELVTRLLERMGFRGQTTKATGDGGVDIVAILDLPLVGGRYLVQCKRYAQDSPVGAAAVREFYGALTADRRAVKGILITTSGFTAQATEFAKGLPIELIARDKLLGLLKQHGLLKNSVPDTHPLARLITACGSLLEIVADLDPTNSTSAQLRSSYRDTAQTLIDFLCRP